MTNSDGDWSARDLRMAREDADRPQMDPMTAKDPCPKCRGGGRTVTGRKDMSGRYDVYESCRECGGTGDKERGEPQPVSPEWFKVAL